MKNLYLKSIIAISLLSNLLFSSSVDANKISNICKNLYQQKLKYIINNGWGNKSLAENSCILKLEKKDIPVILKKIEKIDTLKSSKEYFKIEPKNSIKKLLLYIKYLEANSRYKEALTVYLSLIKLTNVKNPNIVLVFIKSYADNRLTESLTEAFKKGLYSKDEKYLLYKHLSTSLVVNYTLILQAFDNERDKYIKSVEDGIKNNPNIIGENSAEFMENYSSYTKKFIYDKYEKIKVAFIKNDFKELIKEDKKDRAMFDSKFKMAKFSTKVALAKTHISIKRKLGLKITENDYYNFFEIALKPLLNFTFSVEYKDLSTKYYKFIKKNKIFLSKLKESISK